MIRTLDRYVARVFIASFCAAILLAAGMFILTDMLNSVDNVLAAGEKLRKAGAPQLADHVGLLTLRYYAFGIAVRLLQFTPFVTFFAAVFTAARLHRTSETVAIMASGTSLHRGFAAVFVAATMLLAFQFTFRESLVPPMARELQELEANLIHGTPIFEVDHVYAVGADGARCRFAKYRPHTRAGEDLRIDSTDGGAYLSVTAKSARFQRDEDGIERCHLAEGKLVRIPRSGSAAATTVPIETIPAGIALTSSDCELACRANEDPMYLSIGELETLARRVPSVAKFQVLFHSAITGALANLLLPLLGLPCVLRADKRSSLEGAVKAFALCVLYFVATLFSYQLGAEQVLGPLFAAWLPVVLFGSLGIALFESMRT